MPFFRSSSTSVLFLWIALLWSVAAAETIDLTWRLGTLYQPRTVNVGDTVTFTWTGVHNVYIHPSGTCDETNSIEVGTVSGASYTFTQVDTDGITFACQVSVHCEIGQIITFFVQAAPTDAPTYEPTVAPVAMAIEPTMQPAEESMDNTPQWLRFLLGLACSATTVPLFFCE